MNKNNTRETADARRYRNYVLCILLVVYTLNFVDRQVLAILAQPIKEDLDLKDWQLGFLTGTAFAIFYATLGIPIARLADRWHRVNVLTISIVIWSFMTVVSGAVANFFQLAIARIGVAVGEAGGSPPSASLISDYFPPEKRQTALGIYTVGTSLGTFVGFLIGGWVNEWVGWRWAFVFAGAPGLVVAIIVKLTVREPVRGMSEKTAGNDDLPKFSHVFKILWAIRTYRFAILGASAASFMVYGFLVWIPVYTIRTFDVGTGTTGTVIGLIAGVAGGISLAAGGWISDKASLRNPRAPMLLAAATHTLSAVFLAAALFVSSYQLFLALLVPCYMLAVFYNAAVWNITQAKAPLRTRAMAAAILLLFLNLIGLGLGPQSVGIISDVFNNIAAPAEGLRFGLLSLCAASPVAGLFFYLASVSK